MGACLKVLEVLAEQVGEAAAGGTQRRRHAAAAAQSRRTCARFLLSASACSSMALRTAAGGMMSRISYLWGGAGSGRSKHRGKMMVCRRCRVHAHFM